jgi:hypothetical protein
MDMSKLLRPYEKSKGLHNGQRDYMRHTLKLTNSFRVWYGCGPSGKYVWQHTYHRGIKWCEHPSVNEAIQCLDQLLIDKGYTLLTQAQVDKLMVLM